MKNPKVWIIDDNFLHSKLVGAVLREKKIECKIFCSVEEIKQCILQKKIESLPDIILIDLHLDKGERGEELLNFLKDHLNGEVKYIAFTAEIKTKKELLQLGFHNVIYKPVTIKKLEVLVENIVKSSHFSS